MAKLIKVEIAYALPDQQTLLAISVAEGTTVKQGVELSGILQQYAELDLQNNAVGIFGKRVLRIDQQELQEGDRIEIYRPLQADPKEVRRRRAEKAANKKA
ncbi:RnfH family protein [Entomomonas sp. E2T0]|uniref:RnfH family protein n=1 Tax=Entomomonas sp. E2T0 TaxID=2930213 RepID=UPI0022283326|nr:RnfH family protein [Entomomonas sp. E2T0]UYZ84597.1 RnfH family protein [Entomomonas sp. E2T0]